MTRERSMDDREVAHYDVYAREADRLAAMLPEQDVRVIGTGGNCPAILVSDGRAEYDVLITRTEDFAGSVALDDAWAASSEQDCEAVVYAPSAVEAFRRLVGRTA